MEKNTTARELHTTQFHLNMYTDLDTLYDTRLSFLERLSSKDWEFMLDNDRWITRLKDNMGNISDKIFNVVSFTICAKYLITKTFFQKKVISQILLLY